MSLRSLLLKMAFIFERDLNPVTALDVDEQLKYIDHFKVPKDDIERSYFQYRCVMKLYGKASWIFLSLASAPIAWYYLLSIKRVKKDVRERANLATFLRDGKPENILPKAVRNRFDRVITELNTSNALTKEDKAYIRRIIKRYPFAWHFILKVVLKIALYRYLINQYNPSAIIVCNEYSFTSSVLTDYCHNNKVRHIDVMHGEKLLYMRDSFFHFDECHVWNEGYKTLFKRLRAEETQYQISIPDSLLFKNNTHIEKVLDYTYYLAAEDDETLERIADSLKKLREKGNSIAIRPHPRYSKMESIEKIFSGFEVENYKKISIEESVLRSRNAISLYSTVLNQAFHNGVNVVIDDVSNYKYFKKLEKLQYVMLSEKHTLLSELISGDEQA